MTIAAALFVVVGILGLAQLTGIPSRATHAIARCRAALATVRNRALDDAAKERALRADAVALFGAFVALTVLGVVAVAVPLAIVALLDGAGVVAFDAVVDRAIAWDVAGIATILAIVVILSLRSRRS